MLTSTVNIWSTNELHSRTYDMRLGFVAKHETIPTGPLPRIDYALSSYPYCSDLPTFSGFQETL